MERCRVVKVGGRAQADPALAPAIAAAVRSGDRVCVVHGGGDEVSLLQRRLGLEPTFLGGRRVTSAADLEVVRMVLSGTTNKRLVAQLLGAGVRAAGVSGEDAGLFRARVTDARLGRVGGDIAVDPEIVSALIGAGFTPVVSPLARDADDPAGAGLNVNGDDAAAALAAALGAEDLVLVADIPGVLQGSAVIQMLDRDAARELVTTGVATGGMTAKLDAAQRALDAGVACVRIADIRGITDRTAGTRIVPSQTTAR
ncbi:MAG: acetylglutamate kinase [Gemmatimonadota bacterium]|nr:acetylglutamate kinase [Gemmatimonadota bacterium]